MVKFCKSVGIKVKDYVQTKKKQVTSMALVLGAAAYNATPSHAAALSTGNPDVDEFANGFIGMFDVAKLGFKGLALASIVLTIVVVLFFWIRGKAKQSVAGA